MAQSTNQQIPQQNLTFEQMLELIKGYAAEMKKPDAETQAKLDADKARRKQEVEAMVEEAKQFDRQQAAMQANCPHHNGKNHTWNGQVTTNGDARAFCSRCGKDYAWQADLETVRAGVLGLQENKHLTEEMLAAAEKKAPPKIIANRLKRAAIAGAKA